MGLFSFFKKKDKKQENTSAESEPSRVLLAMPLFKDGESYDIHKVIEHLKDFWGAKVDDSDGVDNETAVFYIDGQMVAIAKMPTPVPGDDLENAASYNYMWPTAMEELKDHTGHAIVTVMSTGDKSTVERYSLLSKMLSSILMTSNSVGVYQGDQTLLLAKDYYLNCLDDLQNGGVPVPVWVYIGLRGKDDNTVSLYTYGLEHFGKYEMEILDSKMTASDLYDFLLNITSYVIGKDVALRDGETIGYSADHKVPIKLSKGVHLEGETLKLKL